MNKIIISDDELTPVSDICKFFNITIDDFMSSTQLRKIVYLREYYSMNR